MSDWKKIKAYSKNYDMRLQISVKGILTRLFRNVDFDRIMYRQTVDFEKKRIIIEFKHGKTDEE